jgi:hypothetical protein
MSEMNPQSAESDQNPIRHQNKIPTSKEMNTADTPKSKNHFPIPNRNADVSPIRRLYKPEAPIVRRPFHHRPPPWERRRPRRHHLRHPIFHLPSPIFWRSAPISHPSSVLRSRPPVECAASSTGPLPAPCCFPFQLFSAPLRLASQPTHSTLLTRSLPLISPLRGCLRQSPVRLPSPPGCPLSSALSRGCSEFQHLSFSVSVLRSRPPVECAAYSTGPLPAPCCFPFQLFRISASQLFSVRPPLSSARGMRSIFHWAAKRPHAPDFS